MFLATEILLRIVDRNMRHSLVSNRKDHVNKCVVGIVTVYVSLDKLSNGNGNGSRKLQITGVTHQGFCSGNTRLVLVFSTRVSYCCWLGSSMAMQ